MSAKLPFKQRCLGEVTSLLDCFDAAVVLIGHDYEILSTNDAYRRLYGGEVPAPGSRCYEVSHHYDRPCHEMGEECPMQACLESGTPQRVLHLHHSPQGEEHVDVELCPLHDGEGELSAFIEVIHPLHSDHGGPARLVGRSAPFTRMLELIGRVAPSDAAVLLLGESGTGKELAAHAIHKASRRAGGPFVPVDCSGLTESLFESELFGHEKGAFTGAHSRKQGLVEAARGGTLFLDEIGDVPLNLQVKLLRLLETSTFRRVGGVEPQQADFRLVCATHRGLPQMVESGEFRRDLYYRLSAFPIELPPLRERHDDLPALVTALLKRICPERPMRVTPEAMACLQGYHFPGNIRELRNILERAVLLADDEEISCAQLPAICGDSHPRSREEPMRFTTLMPLQELEENYLRWAQRHHGEDRHRLAAALGVSERTLYRKLERVTKK